MFCLNRFSPLSRIIGLTALALVLAGCSAVKLGYNTAAEAGYWWLDSYLDLHETQGQRVRDDLGRLHQWHRANELPRYADLLGKMERMAAGEVTAAQACSLVSEARGRLDALAEQAEPPVVTAALGLTPRQLQHLERKYAKNNAEYRREWIAASPAEVKEKRFKQLVDRSEMIYGRLDEAQYDIVRQQLDKSAFDPARILAERQRRQQDLLATLRKVAGQPVPLAQARSLMRGYFDRVNHSPNAAYQAYQDALIQESCAAFAAAHNSTTPAQREAAARRLRAYQRDLRELAAQR